MLQFNSKNVHAMLQLASISRMQERFEKAVEYLHAILEIDGASGEVHGAIGHCYLTLSQRAEGVPAILDCLKKCYDAYREASLHLGAFNDPNLWYGVGLLYERYGALMQSGTPLQRECYQAAEEALQSVLRAAPDFEKRAEILYRLGMIYKHQGQPQQALECLQAICDAPPPPLMQHDVWYLIGAVQEHMEPPAPDFAKQAYEHVLRLMQMAQEPKVARVYRQLGWVCHKWNLQPPMVAPHGVHHQVQQPALLCLQQALEADPNDAANWHYVAKCLLDHSEFESSYDCLVHAVALDPASADIWETLGDLYARKGGRAADAAVAYEHAVHLNSRSTAWYGLGTARHEVAMQQQRSSSSSSHRHRSPRQRGSDAIGAAIDAYTRALSVCTDKREVIASRLEHLRQLSASPLAAASGDGGCNGNGHGADSAPSGGAGLPTWRGGVGRDGGGDCQDDQRRRDRRPCRRRLCAGSRRTRRVHHRRSLPALRRHPLPPPPPPPPSPRRPSPRPKLRRAAALQTRSQRGLSRAWAEASRTPRHQPRPGWWRGRAPSSNGRAGDLSWVILLACAPAAAGYGGADEAPRRPAEASVHAPRDERSKEGHRGSSRDGMEREREREFIHLSYRRRGPYRVAF